MADLLASVAPFQPLQIEFDRQDYRTVVAASGLFVGALGGVALAVGLQAVGGGQPKEGAEFFLHRDDGFSLSVELTGVSECTLVHLSEVRAGKIYLI